uniref:Uncharacterized protein n=1 Tax=Setaria digitata TaxID=48799 RepID=A0A915PKX8_9BILA
MNKADRYVNEWYRIVQEEAKFSKPKMVTIASDLHQSFLWLHPAQWCSLLKGYAVPEGTTSAYQQLTCD